MLCLGILLVNFLSSLQPALQLLENDLLATDLRLDGQYIFLKTGVTEESNALAQLARMVMSVQLVCIHIRVEGDVLGRNKINLARAAGIGHKKSTSPLRVDEWGDLTGNGETECRRKRF